MTEEEKIICKQFLNDADKTHSCNEYKLLMALLDQEPNCSEISTSSDNLGVDCISRADAIHAVSEALKHTFVEYEDIANKVIGKLPSVTPQLSSGLDKNSKKLEKDFGELDCISRAAARSLICNTDIKHHMSGMSRKVFKDLYNGMDELPPVTPIRPEGHWIEEFNDLEGEVRFTCSSCGKYQLFGTDFCYHCGSDNREVVEE